MMASTSVLNTSSIDRLTNGVVSVSYTHLDVYKRQPSVQRWFEVHHRMLAWTDGRRVRMQVARDITERRGHEEASRVQQEKIQLTSRLTTMGEMASSLAHELNPVSYTHLDVYKRQSGDRPR